MNLPQFGIDVYDRISKSQKLKNNIRTIALLTLLESKVNLELIDSIKISKSDKSLYNDKDIVSIIAKLQTDNIELLILSILDSKEMKKTLNSKFEDIEILSKKQESQTKNHLQNETAFEPICKIYVKITSLKELIQIENKGNALKNLNLKKNLPNLFFKNLMTNSKRREKI